MWRHSRTAVFVLPLTLLGFQGCLRSVEGRLFQPQVQGNRKARGNLSESLHGPSTLVNRTFERDFEEDDLPFELVPFDFAEAGSNRSRIVNRERPLIWVHIHKAAGTFMCHMAGYAGESIIHPHANCNWQLHDNYRDSGFPSRVPECAHRVNYMSGQGSTYAQVERELYDKDFCFDLFDYGVLLREPVDLIHSNLNYLRVEYNKNVGKHTLVELRNRLDAATPLPTPANQYDDWKFLDNIQVRLLANAVGAPAGKVTGQHLAVARQRLSNFLAVGRVEDLPTRGKDMFKAIGWNEGLASHIRVKANHVSSDVIHFTPEEDAWLREVNHIDMQLWNEFAGGRFRGY